MWISKKEHNRLFKQQEVKLYELQERCSNLFSQLNDLKDRVWKLQNPPKFSTYQEILDGVIITDLNTINHHEFGFKRTDWQYCVLHKKEKRHYWICEKDLLEKINQSNKKQTNKTKKK